MKTAVLSKSGSFPPGDKPGNEIKELAQKAHVLAQGAKSEATKKAYKKDWDSFVDWTTEQNLSHIPAEVETIVLYITHMDTLGRAPATITRALTSISQAHKLKGYESPTYHPQCTEVLKGIRRHRGTAQRQAKPLLAANMKKIVRACPPGVLGKRDRALLLLGWAGALRRSELVGLDYEDIESVEEGILLIIRKSKGDQEKKGQKVAIPELENEFCPVKALYRWQSIVAKSSGSVFCPVGLMGKNRFFYQIDKVRRLSARSVSIIVKKYVKIIGLNPDHYSAHSLRAGWTTSAAAIGVPEHLLMKHTRHRSRKTVQGYIRDGQLFTDNPLPLLLAP